MLLNFERKKADLFKSKLLDQGKDKALRPINKTYLWTSTTRPQPLDYGTKYLYQYYLLIRIVFCFYNSTIDLRVLGLMRLCSVQFVEEKSNFYNLVISPLTKVHQINSHLNVVVQSLTPFELKWLLAFPRVPVTLGNPKTETIFSLCCPLNDCRRAACSLIEMGRLSLTRLRFFILLLLMSGNVHPNPGPVFPCSVCLGNVTWWGRSVQFCTCFKWIHLRCSLLSFSRFRTLGHSHSLSCPLLCPCFCRSHTYQHCDYLLRLLQLVYLHCSIWPLLC